MKIVLATHNRDKVKEIEAILSGLDLTVLTLNDFPGAPDVIEDGDTLEHNALKKAREIREFTGMSALADDSGLEVDALDGAPGVYSSRFAGENVTYEDNNRKLLSLLEGVPREQRTARFRCCMALALIHEDRERIVRLDEHHETAGVAGRSGAAGPLDALVTEGAANGIIATELRGRTGFGYDPLFEVPNLGRTFAEIPIEEKNRISHRYRALVEMRELMLRYRLVEAATE